MTVLIGYGRDTNNDVFFIRSDESTGPYNRVYLEDDPLGNWDLLLVPTPGKLYLNAESAEGRARVLFEGLLNSDVHRQRRKTLGKRLRLRTYAIQAGDYKVAMRERGLPPRVMAAHRPVGTSNWVWVVELQDPGLYKTTRRCVVGEIVFDATSDQSDPSALFGNVPTQAYHWREPRERPIAVDVEDYEPYFSGTALHDAPSAPSTKGRARRRVKRARRQALERFPLQRRR